MAIQPHEPCAPSNRDDGKTPVQTENDILHLALEAYFLRKTIVSPEASAVSFPKINRIVILGLGTNQDQLAEILGMVEFFMERYGRLVDVYAHDPVYEHEPDFVALLEDLDITVLRFPATASSSTSSVQFPSLPDQHQACEPLLDFITSTTMLYTPHLTYDAYPHLLSRTVPEMIFGSMVDSAMGDIDFRGGLSECRLIFRGIDEEQAQQISESYRKALECLPHIPIGAFNLHKRADTLRNPQMWETARTSHYEDFARYVKLTIGKGGCGRR